MEMRTVAWLPVKHTEIGNSYNLLYNGEKWLLYRRCCDVDFYQWGFISHFSFLISFDSFIPFPCSSSLFLFLYFVLYIFWALNVRLPFAVCTDKSSSVPYFSIAYTIAMAYWWKVFSCLDVIKSNHGECVCFRVYIKSLYCVTIAILNNNDHLNSQIFIFLIKTTEMNNNE